MPHEELKRLGIILLRVNLMAVIPLIALLTAVSDDQDWPTVKRHVLVILVMTNFNFLAFRTVKRRVWAGSRHTGGTPFQQARAVLILAVTAAATTFLAALFLNWVAPGALQLSVGWAVIFGAVVTLLIGLGILGYEDFRRLNQITHIELRETQKREQEMSKAWEKAQLTALQALVKPHFLFNSLNAIATLIEEDPEKAEAMTLKLARLLRYILEIQGKRIVSLRCEVSILRAYLEIEEARCGDRLSYKIDIPESLGDVQVPPMFLQPLVENAIKHGINQRVTPGSISVSAWISDGHCHFEVIDDGPGTSSPRQQGTGSGLGLVRGQLRYVYGASYDLQMLRNSDTGQTIVSLSIPIISETADPAPSAFQRITGPVTEIFASHPR